MAKVFISVGHGGDDPGAIGVNKVKESEKTLELSKAVEKALKAVGVDVKLSRTGNNNNPQSSKLKQIESYKPDIAIDIHFNAYNGKATGTETYYQHNVSRSKNLAENLARLVAQTIGITNRGAKVKLLSDGRDYFGMLRKCSTCPIVLLETCFIDNSSDMAKAMAADVAGAIAKCLCTALDINYDKKKDDINKGTDDTYTVMTVAPSSGLWLQKSDKRWNASTRLYVMPKGDTVLVFKGSEKKLGQYTCVKVNHSGDIGYCAKDYLI